MKHRIFLKLVICYLIYGIVAFILICTFTARFTNHQMIKSESQDLLKECSFVASDYAKEYYSSSTSLDEFQKQMELLSKYLSSEIWIIDTKGNILINSADKSYSESVQNQEYRSIHFNPSDFGNNYYTTGNFYNEFEDSTLSVYSSITVNYDIMGYVLIHKPVKNITVNADGFTNITSLTILIIFIFSMIIFVVFTLSIYRPIIKIDRVADKYAKGDFTEKVELSGNDEIAYLANTMNYMAKELDTLEEDQRKFVSNVSHDFRSPLTSIKGYVEAMLDGTIPVEMQDKYLNIILFETNRLTKLTQGLLDLNQFGNHTLRLDVADFDINQMIRTTILTFEGTCQKKGITFDLVLTGKELFVNADMTKIQQVIYNLIDNATKFSHHNSSIEIETIIKNNKVLVSVKDHGIGIPGDSIKKVWERFYKTDSSRGKDKRGTGLGLAIVKEIITAHNEHINVISTEGAGTEFIFTLPLSQKEK